MPVKFGGLVHAIREHETGESFGRVNCGKLYALDLSGSVMKHRLATRAHYPVTCLNCLTHNVIPEGP